MKIGGNVLSVAGTFLFFIAPPVGIAVGVIGVLMNLIGGLSKSRDQKRRKSVANISSSLESQLKKGEKTILKQTARNFSNYYSNLYENINQYFNELIQGLEAISNQLAKAQISLNEQVDYLNYGYAKRIIDWSLEKYQPLNYKIVKKTIIEVKRNFGKKIEIKTKTNIELKKSLEEMKQILQEDIAVKAID